jgi:L-lactate dehydrogenase complex protein LldE
MLRVGDKPTALLRAVEGLELIELPDADQCCGFGGTFAIKNADTSTAMLADKMRSVLDTGAEVCSAGDSSCLMHIGGGLSRIRAGATTLHLAQILASTVEHPLLLNPPPLPAAERALRRAQGAGSQAQGAGSQARGAE